MARIKREDAMRFKKYVWALFEEVVRTQRKGITSGEISSYIQSRLKVDVRNRVNAILALGAEVGLVNMKQEGRFLMKRGVSELDKLLDTIA
ncbi:unnamed protein product [Nezara viridula]|uniref:Uncharacterized protein n=1 Tax=Nezara viridula TaxID=85310 RepID=A0A9P0MVV0_NEZVI|nr:unnamed protein product [Nezara viridula]